MNDLIKCGKKEKSIIAAVLSIVVLLSLVFSVYFIQAEAHHDCIGDDCPICATLDLCEATVKQLSASMCACFSILISFACIDLVKSWHVISFRHLTPVDEKIRMNN